MADHIGYIYICQDCGYEFEVSMDELIKDL